MGEHLRALRAGLRAAGGAPGSLLPAARAGTRSDRGARSPASAALPLLPEGSDRAPVGGHCPLGARDARRPRARSGARASRAGDTRCVCVCVLGGRTAGCVTSRGCPPRHPALGTGTAAAEPSSLPGLAPGLPDPSWAGPGREAPGGIVQPRLFNFFCFSGEVVLSVWGSRLDRFELQRSRRGEVCSPPGGWAGGGGPCDRGRPIARPGSSVVLPWTARDPGEGGRALRGSPEPGSGVG